jgi:hypothetical protein
MSQEKIDRTVSGEVWHDFCQTLESAGEIILRPGTPDNPLDRAEGFRYLTRILRLALESELENAEPTTPRLQLGCRGDIKFACDNPDSYYQKATLDSRHEYRIRGRMGTVPYLSIGAYFGGMGKPRSGCSGSLESDQIETDAGGRFEVTISAKEHPGNWIALEREAHQHQLLVRQTYLDKEKDTLAELSIERIGEGKAPALDAAAFHDRLLGAANYVKNNVDLFSGWSRDFEAHPNQALPLDVSKAQGDPNFFYFQGYWKLAPDEALVIELMPPECDYWNFQLNNYWLESLDYRDHRIEINNGAMRLESDGSARIVVAHQDPGHPNWIETAHHPHGTMGLRIVKGKEVPTLEQRVMKVGDVPSFSGLLG